VLFALKNAKWEEEFIKLIGDAFVHTVFQTHKCPKGLIMHICDFYIEEIAKVADGELAEERVFLLVEPFMIYYTKLNDTVLLPHVEKNIFNQLLYQSELGQEYQEKFDIWKAANFPTRSIDDLEVNYKVRENKSFNDDDLSDGQEEDEEERALDPRAGRVDVVLSEIKFDALKIAETMENLRYKSFASSKSRKGLARMAGKFRKFTEDVFPLGVGSLPKIADDDDSEIDIDLKAMELAEFEKKLAIGDVDSESSSDFDEDLDNRKHGKLKRKNKEQVTKAKEKKQKLSKLHNERFFKDPTEDFTKENSSQPEEEESNESTANNESLKLNKKKKKKVTEEETPRKIKIKRKKSLQNETTTSKSSDDECIADTPSTSTTNSVKESSKLNKKTKKDKIDEWSEPLQEGETEIFLPSRKHKLKMLQNLENNSEESTSNLVLNPFAKHTGNSSATAASSKKAKLSTSSSTTTPRIQQGAFTKSGSTGKRVIIALNKNKAQSPHEYIKQVKDSPNLPYDSNKKPTKSLLKPNAIPSPINPFYQKKIGLKLNFNETM
jgi:ribosomal RNA-processing protein 1